MFQRLAPALPTFPELPQPTARDRGRAWHRGSQFASAGDFRPLDRNDRFRVWTAAQGLERRTHTPGKHGGMLGHSGLAVLRCLLFDFLNIGSGRLDPSYEEIADRTGYARDTVIEAVKRLSLAGILEITRRIIRERVKHWCELAGKVLWVWRTRQTSNAYRLNYPLPDRRELGDLGAPLLRHGLLGVKAESESRTETTPVSKSVTLDDVADPQLRASLARWKASMDARDAQDGQK